MQTLLRIIVAISLMALAAEAASPDAAGTLTAMPAVESGPGQSPEEIARRVAWQAGRSDPWRGYSVANERFSVYVPPTVKKGEPAGLMVFVWPDGKARVPEQWREVLDDEKLIFVCPENAGNDRDPVLRMALALDAVWNAKKRLAVDGNRVLVSGLSGGGRIASILVVAYPEVFTGAIPIIGCNYYRDVRSAKRAAYYKRGYLPPAAKILSQAKGRPIAILEGEDDMNQDQSLVYSRAMRADGFRNVTYLEVPGMAHVVPPGEWFAKAITAATAVPTTQTAASRPAVR